MICLDMKQNKIRENKIKEKKKRIYIYDEEKK